MVVPAGERPERAGSARELSAGEHVSFGWWTGPGISCSVSHVLAVRCEVRGECVATHVQVVRAGVFVVVTGDRKVMNAS